MQKYQLTSKNNVTCLLTYEAGRLSAIDFGETETSSEYFCWLAKTCFFVAPLIEHCQLSHTWQLCKIVFTYISVWSTLSSKFLVYQPDGVTNVIGLDNLQLQ